MRATSFDGTTLHYEVEGPADAPVVLLSNSLGTTLDMWSAQMAALLTRLRVVRYDTRGHGRSDVPPGPYAIETLGRDALAVLDAAGAERAHFAGLSLGGMTGMWVAANRPGRVNRLVLSNTAAFLPPRELWDERMRTVREKGMAGILDAVVNRWFTKAFQERAPEAVEPVKAMILATPVEGYVGCSAAIRDMDQRDTIRLIQAPALVIAGRHDPATTVAQAQEIRDEIPGARLEVLEAAHLSNIEAKDDYNRILIDYLAA